MKKQLLFMAFIASVAMNFIACSSSDEATEKEQGSELKLSAGITAQREPYDINEWGTNIDIGSIDASAAKESKVKVDKALTRNTVDNDNWVGMSNRKIAVQAGGSIYQYSVDENGILSSNSPYYFTTLNNVSIASWYPYSASLSTFSVQTDQTSFANYEKSDLLYATTTVNQSSPNVSLTYAHKTAKLIFNVKITNSQNLYSSAITGVTLSNIYYKGNVANGNIAATDKGTIKMYNIVASSTSASNVTTATFEACVVPQTSAISYAIVFGGKTYSGAITEQTISAGRIYTCDVNLDVPATGTINGHTWVRLGLPNDIKWATTNLGANTETDFGDYYQWGSTKTYAQDTTQWLRERNGRYNIQPESGHDACRENWKGTWRMPTETEFWNMLSNTTMEYTSKSGVNGVSLTSKKNGRSIFFPNCGLYAYGTFKNYHVNSNSFYWTATTNSAEFSYQGHFAPIAQHALYNMQENKFEIRSYKDIPGHRILGFPIRAVSN